jgi:hypothetical protein
LNGLLLRRSKKNEELGRFWNDGTSSDRPRTICWVRTGNRGAFSHVCRHYWLHQLRVTATDAFALQEAGGWSSLAMPRRYIDDNEIANEVSSWTMNSTKVEPIERADFM